MNNIPNGYKLVPTEPTEAMHDAARDWSIQRYGKAIGSDASRGCYSVMLSAATAPPQPIYDEAKERELFEAFQADEGGNIDCEDGYYDNVFVQSAWDGWKACAQSRAKAGEDE